MIKSQSTSKNAPQMRRVTAEHKITAIEKQIKIFQERLNYWRGIR